MGKGETEVKFDHFMSFSGSSHKKECKEKKKVGGITF
jgi:hypothetical protein